MSVCCTNIPRKNLTSTKTSFNCFLLSSDAVVVGVVRPFSSLPLRSLTNPDSRGVCVFSSTPPFAWSNGTSLIVSYLFDFSTGLGISPSLWMSIIAICSSPTCSPSFKLSTDCLISPSPWVLLLAICSSPTCPSGFRLLCGCWLSPLVLFLAVSSSLPSTFWFEINSSASNGFVSSLGWSWLVLPILLAIDNSTPSSRSVLGSLFANASLLFVESTLSCEGVSAQTSEESTWLCSVTDLATVWDASSSLFWLVSSLSSLQVFSSAVVCVFLPSTVSMSVCVLSSSLLSQPNISSSSSSK